MRRRNCLLLAISALAPGAAAEPASRPALPSASPSGSPPGSPPGRSPRRARQAPRRPAPAPSDPAAPAQILPPIDTPAVQPIGPGFQPAPVPSSSAQPPLADRESRPSVSFGVQTPPLYGQGETFQRQDSFNDSTPTHGIRLPSPGATIRLPWW